MTKIIRGWNDIPEGYVQEEDFHLAPLWLRTLARIKYFEKFAYPAAVKKGLVRRWKIEPDENAPEFSWSDGIQYLNSEYPGFKYGSPIEVKMKKTKIPLPFFLLRIASFFLLLWSFITAPFFTLFATKWGRNRKSEYMKSKISAQKN
jgi:hypothetical protein